MNASKCRWLTIHYPNRCASSKHLQTRRFLDTLKGYLPDMQRILVQLHLSANQRPEPFVDHAGVLRDSKTGRPINGAGHRALAAAEVSSAAAYDDEDTMREFPFLSACSPPGAGRRARVADRRMAS